MIIGDFCALPFIPTEQEIEKAKDAIVKSLCNAIVRLSKEYPEEFFITKDVSEFPVDNSVLTIGAKLILPTISNKE